jgi:lysophospholipase L1-like esterase
MPQIRRHLVRLATAGAAALLGSGALVPAADAAPLACPLQQGTDHYLCSWYTAGNGTSGGTPVQAANGTRVGFLHQGRNWIVCQQRGSRVTRGGATNVWWGFTTADNGRTGWANAVYARGGTNDGIFGSGVPNCNGRHGSAPVAKAAAPTPAPPAPKPALKPRYVALGDSFSSGEGAGSDSGAAPGRPAACHRSKHAYAPRLAGSNRDRYRFSQSRDFLACSGDEVPDVQRRQLPRMGSNIGVVTISIGGNDVGFASVIESCIANQRPGGKTCDRIIKDTFRTKLPRLRTRLNTLYSQISARAPGARVIVLGYPALFEDSYSAAVCYSTVLTRGARSDLRAAADTLADTIRPIAEAHGFPYVDPRGAFKDHRVCSSGEDWIHGIVGSGGPESFHPKSRGQKGFADAIRDQAGVAFD